MVALRAGWKPAVQLGGVGVLLAVRYSAKFFEGQAGGSAASADVVVPLLMELIKPASVVDVGCGTGTWLRAFVDRGVTDVLGFDGDYVPRSELRIDEAAFRACDLTKPLETGRAGGGKGGGFDLAISLEVGEHLPEPAAATLVGSLTGAAPVVAFSAAVPLQGGTGHLNEQWPTYWARLFEQRGFVPVDAIRPLVWEDERIAWWYRQNLLLYVRETDLARYAGLAEVRRASAGLPLSIVHPRLLEKRNRKPIRPLPRIEVMRAWVRGVKSGKAGKQRRSE